jgi:uncharacterized protein (TIGR03083 family)
MDSLADRTIAALRTNHDELATFVAGLSDEQLTGPSGAAEWPVAQVLSHLGSGAEITLAGLDAAIADTEAPGPEFNESVWDRWNALPPAEQASAFLEHNAALVAAYEALTPEQRENVSIGIGFLPFPLSIAAGAGLRLNEAALHGWDAHAGIDPGATLDAGAADLLAEQLSGEVGFLLGFIGQADQVEGRVVVDVHGRGLVIDDGVSLTERVEDATATFDGPLEAALRLMSGRLGPDHTPDGVDVSGNVTLDDLRRVFPGY